MTTAAAPATTASAVLAGLREQQAAALAAEAAKLELAAEWGRLHATRNRVERYEEDWYEHDLALGGEGCPEVREYAVTELAAALGVSTLAGRAYLSDAVELNHRLPATWTAVHTHVLPAWKARRIAQATRPLPPAGAAFVDAQLAAVAHRVGFAQLDRLITEARDRFDPEAAEEDRLDRLEDRHVHIGTDEISSAGAVAFGGVLDLPDALDLEEAVAARAHVLLAEGSTDPLQVRRAKALGDVIRQYQGTLPFGEDDRPVPRGSREPTEDNETPRREAAGPGPVRRPRQVVLYLHLSDEALAGSPEHQHVRIENTGTHTSLDQVAEWLRTLGTTVTLRPVVDLNAEQRVDAYQVPDRFDEHVALRDGTCVFPYCTRPARGCDTDHIVPWDDGGPTATDNLAALCRPHHRAKTHGGWTYTPVEPGLYLWRSPHGLRYVRHHDGTTLPEP